MTQLPDLRTPCCNAKFGFVYYDEGRAYMPWNVVGEIYCTAEGCYNSWDENGENGG